MNLRAPGLSKEARGACGAVGGALFPGGGELAVRGGGWWEALEGGPELGAVTDIGDQVWILGLWYGSVLSHGMSHNATPSINTSSQTKALVQCWSQLQPTKVNFSCEPNFLASTHDTLGYSYFLEKLGVPKVGCPVTCTLVIQLQGKIYCVARTIKIANSWFQFISQPLNWLQIDMADAFAKGSRNDLYPVHKGVLYIFLPKALRVKTVTT